jgi:holo-[acyl-carrier protein] synthase
VSVLGLGTDIVEVARIARLVEDHGDRFLRRVYQPGELVVLERQPAAAAAALAARWAAKEACIKALGAAATGVGYRSIEVVREASGQPRLVLHGPAASALAELGGTDALVTLSHERDHAVATVLLLG